MNEVRWAGCRLPIVPVTRHICYTKQFVSDHSREQDRSNPGAKTHQSNLVVEEHESENQRGGI